MPYRGFSSNDVGVCLSTLTPNPRGVDAREVEAILRVCKASGFPSIVTGAGFASIIGLDRFSRLLSELGLVVRVIEAITAWTSGAESARAETEYTTQFAATVGADIVMAATIEPHVDMGRAAEGLASACKVACDSGLRVALEFIPGTAVPDLKTAWRLVRECGAANAGLVIDCLHWQHQPGGPDFELLRRIPPERIYYVQLCDSPVAVSPAGEHYLPFAMTDRVVPGAGIIDIDQFLLVLESRGADPYFALEVYNPALAAAGPEAMAGWLWLSINRNNADYREV